MLEENRNYEISRDVETDLRAPRASSFDNPPMVQNIDRTEDFSSTNQNNSKPLSKEEIEIKKKSNFRIFVLFIVIDLAMLGVIIWQIVSLFIDLFQN